MLTALFCCKHSSKKFANTQELLQNPSHVADSCLSLGFSLTDIGLQRYVIFLPNLFHVLVLFLEKHFFKTFAEGFPFVAFRVRV